MAAVYKRAVPCADDAMNLPVQKVERAVPFDNTIMGFQVLERKDGPHKAVVLGRDEIRIALAENGGDRRRKAASRKSMMWKRRSPS